MTVKRHNSAKWLWALWPLILLLFLGLAGISGAQEVPEDTRYGRWALSTMTNGPALVDTYDRLVEGIASAQAEIPLDYVRHPINVTELGIVFNAYRNDNCTQYWCSGNFSYTYFGDGESAYITVVKVTYNTTFAQYSTRAEFDKKVDQLYASLGIRSSMSDYEKALIIHDFIAGYLTYDSEAAKSASLNVAHTVYGAVMNQTAVCEGYAKMYQLFLGKAGIRSHMLTGMTSGGNHAWNLCRIDGHYCLTDVTWDDQNAYLYYIYFNRPQSFFDETRSTAAVGYPLPECKDDSVSYYGQNQLFMSSTPDVARLGELFSDKDTVRLYITGDNYTSFGDNFLAQLREIGMAAGMDGNKSISMNCRHLSREYIVTMTGTRITSQSVTVTGGTAKSSSGTVTKASSGTKITITAGSPPSGQYFVRWNVEAGGVKLKDANASQTTFTMGDAPVRITAVFQTIPALKFTDSASFDIPEGNAGTAISAISLSSGVSGGVAPLTYQITSGPSWLSISSAGKITGTRPASDTQAATATVQVKDALGQTAKITIAVGAVTVPRYAVTVKGGKALLGSQTVTEAKPGDILTVVADAPQPGMRFVRWTLTGTSVSFASTSATASFPMPQGPITLSAEYEKIPETTVPPATQPPTTQPETSEPAASEPETSKPETTEPQTSVPQTSRPTSTEPETTEPETTEPQTSVPQTSQPTSTEPETTEPETTEPQTSVPQTSRPTSTEPESSAWDIPEPDTTEPLGTENSPDNPKGADEPSSPVSEFLSGLWSDIKTDTRTQIILGASAGALLVIVILVIVLRKKKKK